jgi:molybdopterin molybdotransferase
MTLLPVEDALAAILSRVPEVEPERVALAQAAGRVLIDHVAANHDQPPFDASAMDGYAVRTADVELDRPLRIVGGSQAGTGFNRILGPGEAVRIFTGAPLPPGADTVIMQEEAVAEGDFVSFTVAARRGHSVRPRGNDFRAGDVLLAPGTRLESMHLLVAAAANVAELTVARRPRIALLATGDELVAPGTPLGEGQIVASNSVGLAALFAPYAQEVDDHGIAADDRTALRGRLATMFAGEPDIVVTTGGASVGEHDLVREILTDLGVELDFWRINMRPGKPLMFGTRGRTLVFGLPGNPVSAMVTALVFIKPALRAWLGVEEPAPLRLPLTDATPPNTARRHYMRARLFPSPNGPAAYPISQTDSGHTSSLAGADLLIIQPEYDPGQRTGAVVDCIPIGQF